MPDMRHLRIRMLPVEQVLCLCLFRSALTCRIEMKFCNGKQSFDVHAAIPDCENGKKRSMRYER